MLIIKECRSFLLVLHSFYNQWADHPTMHLSLQVSALPQAHLFVW